MKIQTSKQIYTKKNLKFKKNNYTKKQKQKLASKIYNLTEKDVFEDFTTLNLTVNDLSKKVLDIHELFANYLKKELINDSDNLYYCDKCKTNTPSEQKTVLFKLPKRLIVIFKRYSDSGVKINKKIKYPIDSMLIKETNSGIIFNYSLTNLIYHMSFA